MVLLEKAFAKLYGAYGGLKSGWQPIAWFHMTGCDNFFRYNFTYESPMKWEVIDSEGIPVYSDKRRSSKLGVLPAGARFHEKQRIGSWIQIANVTDGPSNGWVTYYSKGKRAARRSPAYAPRFFFGHLQVNKATVSASGRSPQRLQTRHKKRWLRTDSLRSQDIPPIHTCSSAGARMCRFR